MEKIKYKGQVYVRLDVDKKSEMSSVANLLKKAAGSCSTASSTLRSATGRTRVHAPNADTDIEALSKKLGELARLVESQIKNGVYN